MKAYGKPVSASLLISEACNLNCSYCFEHEKKNIKMSNQVALDSYNFLYNNALENIKNGYDGSNRISLTMFGGEPMLNFEGIKAIMEEVKKRPKDIQTYIDIITNGTILTQEMADYFKDYIKDNILTIQISMDGTREIHDINRVYHDGRGSYDSIANNIPLFKYIYEDCTNPQIHRLSLHLHGSLNKKTLPYMYETWKTFWDEFGIQGIWFMPIHSETWTAEDVKIYDDQLTKIAVDLMDLTLKHNNIEYIESYSPLNKGASTSCNVNHSAKTCGAGDNYCSITATGDIYVCHQFYYALPEESKIGNIYTGLEESRRRIYLTDYSNDSNCAKRGCKNYDCYRCLAENFMATGTIFNCAINQRCNMTSVETRLITKIREFLLEKGLIR